MDRLSLEHHAAFFRTAQLFRHPSSLAASLKIRYGQTSQIIETRRLEHYQESAAIQTFMKEQVF
jgi:hypothetical protein